MKQENQNNGFVFLNQDKIFRMVVNRSTFDLTPSGGWGGLHIICLHRIFTLYELSNRYKAVFLSLENSMSSQH